jgi:predicted outer membrane lipoprotein
MENDGKAGTDQVRPGEGPEWEPINAPRPRPNGSVLMAAMIGLANALGMEHQERRTEAAQPAQPHEDDLKFNWGGLRPLDD